MNDMTLQYCDESVKTVLKDSKPVLSMFKEKKDYYIKKFQEIITLTKKINELTDLEEKQERELKVLEKKLEKIKDEISRKDVKWEEIFFFVLIPAEILDYITTGNILKFTATSFVYCIVLGLIYGYFKERKLKPLKREKEDLEKKIDSLKSSIKSVKGEVQNYKGKINSFRYELLASLKEISDNPEDALENLERFLQDPLKYLACELWFEVAGTTSNPSEKLIQHVNILKNSVIFDYVYMNVLISAILLTIGESEARINTVLKSYSHQINLFREWSKITEIASQDVNKLTEIKNCMQSLKNQYIPEEAVELLLSLLDLLYEGSVKLPVTDSNKSKLELEQTKPCKKVG